MKYGVSYYPEHKTPEELAHDMKLLKESGINTVRMGEFAWKRMEPEEGCFDFDWLKRAVEELGQAGISTVLCTPTACPPAWLTEKHPDLLYMDNRGIRRPFGGRRHYCYNHERYREYSVKIAEELARAFAGSPYVAGVQIDNEPAQEGTGRCCCPVCRDKFRKWLEKRFGSIEEFNRRSGAVFWSQECDSFGQIPVPSNTIETGAVNQIRAFYENPTLRLCFERFCSESQREYQDLQARAVRRYLKLPVTTNATGLATNSIDYYDSTGELDCYAFDYYPGLRDARVDSFPYAFARGIKGGAPFWVLEFMSGGGHRLGGSGRLQPNPGALKQAVVHSMAHGSGMLLHFQFRTFPFGAEQLNYAILDMDGVPRRRYREMQETAALLKRLEPLEQAAFPGEAAVCFDYASLWALRIKPVNDPAFRYEEYCGKLYHLLEELGITADTVDLNGDWSGYKLLLLPAPIVMSREVQDRIKKFTDGGGVVLATFLTSVKNPDNVGYTGTLPAGLTEVFGSTVEEVEPVFEKNSAEVRLEPEKIPQEEKALEPEKVPQEGKALEPERARQEANVCKDALWSELLGGPSEAIGVYREDYKAGSKVVSVNAYGKGLAFYVGTDLSPETYRALLIRAAQSAGVRRTIIGREPGVELVTRHGEREDYLFLFNFTAHETEIVLPEALQGTVTDYLTGEKLKERVTVQRNGILIAAVESR